MLTRSQKYASLIYDKIKNYEKDAEAAKKYCSLAHKMPILIRKAGLAQALAFAATRKDKEGQKFLSHLAEVVGKGEGECLLTASREALSKDYMYLTYEVMEAVEWFKRFSVSVLGVEADDVPEEGEYE